MAAVSGAILSGGCAGADEPPPAVTVYETLTVPDSPPDVTVVETMEPDRDCTRFVERAEQVASAIEGLTSSAGDVGQLIADLRAANLSRDLSSINEVNARIRAFGVSSTPYYQEPGEFTADLNFPPLNTACR